MRRELFTTCALLAAACSQPDAPVGGDSFHTYLNVPPEPIQAVDILFVIDNSGSMYIQQQALIESAGDALFGQLAAEMGGMPDVHVAVVSSDLGAGTWDIAWCVEGGDQGQFQVSAECPIAIDGTFLRDVDDGAGGRDQNFDGSLAQAFGCAASIGTEGCGYEQHLASMERALDGTNPGNAGFLRDDAMLLVVILADEDDCSTFDTDLFDTSQNTIDSELGFVSSFRCFEFGVVCDGDDPRAEGEKTNCVPRDDSAYMNTVSEYVTFLHGLKADPSMVMVAGIFGNAGPVRVSGEPEQPARPALEDICPGDFSTAPAVRLHALATGFPARWVFSPICGLGDQMPASLRAIAYTLGNVMAARPCLPPEVTADSTCRAFAEPLGGARRSVPLTIASDPELCPTNGSGLAARVPDGALEAGDHLIVECQ